MNSLFQWSDRLKVLPVIHGSSDFAFLVREALLASKFDCVAVPLPGALQHDVVAGVEQLPGISAVVQEEPDGDSASYVPIDPCQPVIAAVRFAIRERLGIEFIDLETERFEATSVVLPDPYALKVLPVERFLLASLAGIPSRVADSQADRRARRMAFELHRLELDYSAILFLPSVVDWPWIYSAYRQRLEYPQHEKFFAPVHHYAVAEPTLTFFLGELPYITALYERARLTLDADEHLSIDGVKTLVLDARDRWAVARAGDRDWLTPKLLQCYFQYVRNLTLIQRRLCPDLYTLVAAAKQIGGDGFALAVLETAKDYVLEYPPLSLETMKMGIGQGQLPGAGVTRLVNRLPGVDVTWHRCELRPEPRRQQSHEWRRTNWDPYKQCSWPAEDDRIESFHTHVRDQAKSLIGADLARAEKFTTSVKDGIDIRETLRNWHTGDIYVKDIPPSRGGIEVVVFLFDVPADPRTYPWRTTWHAEHTEESTIGLFATDFRKDLVGPGIGRARYGGVFFLYPPRYIPDIWTDPRLPAVHSLEEHLLAAALLHSTEKHVAVVAPCPPKSSWRQLARGFEKRLIHLPLARFSGRTIDRLRSVHVLNGKEVRSYAASFIRDE